MQRCIQLALKAAGKTAPNPLVGSVIVKDGKIIGEGYHPQAGQPHAEVFALKDAGEAARGELIDGVPIHSLRLQGTVANQEVIFGGLGQTLSINHVTIDRSSFMPGIMLASEKVMGLDKLVYGLENLL